MNWIIAAGIAWGTGIGCVAAFWIGRGRLIDDWRNYCADFAQEQQVRQAQADADHSERLWAELERINRSTP